MNDGYFADAVTRWARRCTREGWLYQQPDRSLSGREGVRYVLRNCRGALAVFSVKSGRLRLLGLSAWEDAL